VEAVHVVVESRRREIEQLCRELGVRRLDLFGSAVGDDFDEASSDVDVLVEFDDGPGFDYFGAYFALKEGLETILSRPVDVVTAASVKNPYLRDRITRTKELLYAT
jgi:predicted nucleotidyltransferase